MRRKGAEALLDALLVADIGEDFFKDGYLRMLFRRNVQACLRHQCEQTDGLERDGLTAGVRAGNHDYKELAAKVKVDRHDFACEQGMAGVAQVDATLVV